MVGHLADGIGAGVAAEADGHDHFFGVELAVRLRQELRAGDGMEHPLEIVQASHDGGERDHEQGEREESFAPAAGGSPQSEGEDETGESCDQRT